MIGRACVMYQRSACTCMMLAVSRARAQENSWEIEYEIGYTMFDYRNAVRKVMRLVRGRKIDVLMIPDLSCLGTINDMMKIAGALQECGVKLYRLDKRR